MGKKPPKGGTPGTPGTPQQPVNWGTIDLSIIAGRLGMPRDATAQAVVNNLSKKGLSQADIAAMMLDGRKALDFIDNYTPTNSTVDPNTPATAVDIDDAEPDTRGLTSEELERIAQVMATAPQSGTMRDLEVTGRGLRVKGTYRRPLPEIAEGETAPAGGAAAGKNRKPKTPKPGDPDFFAYEDAQADRKYRERGREPPPGVGMARWAKRNPEKAAMLGIGIGAGLGGAGYGIKSAVEAYYAGDEQEQGKFRRETDSRLIQDQENEFSAPPARQAVPAGAAPAGQPTMQAPPNDAAALLMRIQQSRRI